MARKFSWKRATGVSGAKRVISKATGVPTTRSGRKRKVKKMATGSGCCVALAILVGWLVGIYFAADAIAAVWAG